MATYKLETLLFISYRVLLYIIFINTSLRHPTKGNKVREICLDGVETLFLSGVSHLGTDDEDWNIPLSIYH